MIYVTSAQGLLRITPTRNIELVFQWNGGNIQYLTGDNLGNIYFSPSIGSRDSAIYRYTVSGGQEAVIGNTRPNYNHKGDPFADGTNALDTQLGGPSGLWFVTQANRLFFSDRETGIIGVYDPVSKTVSRVGGQFNQIGDTGRDLGNQFGDNGPARDGFLYRVEGIWGDSNHHLFIADDAHQGLREIIFTSRRRALSSPTNETERIHLRGSSQE
jgi:hypothetical protein